MGTRKPIVSVVLSDEQLKAVQDYQFENRVKSQSKAIVELILMGLNEEIPEEETRKKQEDITPRQRYLLNQYEKASKKDKMIVDAALDMDRFEKENVLGA